MDARRRTLVSITAARFDRSLIILLNRLISEHGIHIFDAVNENGRPVFWEAIRKGQYDCANMLLEYAKDEGIAVTFRREDEDLLSWAIENDAYRSVRFILERLTEKCASVEETRDLLARHLRTIGERCPELLADLLKNDKFTIEYARFQVPKNVLDINSKIPKTMITRTIPDNWASMDGEQGKRLWIEPWEAEAHPIDNTTDAQITVTAKVFCISPSVPRRNHNVLLSFFMRLHCLVYQRREHLCESLHDLQLPVEVFESETLVNFIDHWFQVFRPVYQASIILDAVATFTFTIFSLMLGPANEIGELRSNLLKWLITASTVLRTCGAIHLRSLQMLAITHHLFFQLVSEMYGCRFGINLIEWVLFMLILRISIDDHHITYCAFLTSVVCVIQWIAVLAKSILPLIK